MEVRFDGQDGLGVNLANARLGEAEDFGDFAQAHVFKVVKGQDLALHFGKLIEPIGDHAGDFAAKRAVHRVFLAMIGQALVLGDAVVEFVLEGGVEADEGGGANLIEPMAVFAGGDFEGLGHLLLGGEAAFALLDLLHDGLDFARFGVHGTRDPIHAAEFIEDGAANAQAGVSLKGSASGGVILTDGAEQTAEAGAVKVFAIDVRRKCHGEATDDGADEGQIFFDELFLDGAAGFDAAARRPEAIGFGNRLFWAAAAINSLRARSAASGLPDHK